MFNFSHLYVSNLFILQNRLNYKEGMLLLKLYHYLPSNYTYLLIFSLILEVYKLNPYGLKQFYFNIILNNNKHLYLKFNVLLESLLKINDNIKDMITN